MLMEHRHEVEIARMERILRSYGVLTRRRLCEMAGGEHLPVNVRIALEEAVAAGRILALGHELVELPPRAGS